MNVAVDKTLLNKLTIYSYSLYEYNLWVSYSVVAWDPLSTVCLN